MFYENKTYDISLADHTHGKRKLRCDNHLHYHVEIVYMTEGNAAAVVDGREYELVPDSLLVVLPNHPHEYITTQVEKYVLGIISPHIMAETPALLEDLELDSPVLYNVSKYGELYAVLNILKEMSSDTESVSVQADNVVRRGCCAALLGLAIKYLPSKRKEAECSRSMRAVTDYCVRNYNKELSLSVLSDELHMSKYYISHLFGKEFNMKFNDYINSLRVSEACRLLCDTEKSITEISEEVGFTTARTFNRAFSKQYKISPTEYRASSRRQTQ